MLCMLCAVHHVLRACQVLPASEAVAVSVACRARNNKRLLPRSTRTLLHPWRPAPAGALPACRQVRGQAGRAATDARMASAVARLAAAPACGGVQGAGRLRVQRHNEDKLNEAFRTAPGVFLVFSVNMSGAPAGAPPRPPSRACCHSFDLAAVSKTSSLKMTYLRTAEREAPGDRRVCELLLSCLVTTICAHPPASPVSPVAINGCPPHSRARPSVCHTVCFPARRRPGTARAGPALQH